MSRITNFQINTTLLPNTETSREFLVKGKIGAEFTIIALQDGTLKYYNFEDNIFEFGHTSKSNLSISLKSSTYKNSIIFPSGGGTYVIKLLTHHGTSAKNNSGAISRNIEKQSTTSQITFGPATVNTANYQTLPTTNSSGNINDSTSVDYSWTVLNASTDAGGFGLKFHDNIGGVDYPALKADHADIAFINDSIFYHQITKAIVTNVAGDGVDSQKITVADTSDLSIGMELFYHKGTTTPVDSSGAVTGCVIQTIETSTGTVVFNKEVAFENTETMTLRAYGATNISYATGIELEVSNVILEEETLVKTVRGDVSGTNVTLVDTHGISGGLTIGYTGLGVNNSSSNLVNVVTPDCPDPSDSSLDNDGQVTVQLAQELSDGTELTFLNVYKQIIIKGNIKINKYPTANKTINLDLDKILTPGVSGS